MSATRSPRPAVKICGVTREEDARLAVELGAGFIGLNFWSRSPRAIDPRRAATVAAAAKAAGAVAVVGVFVNEERSRIEALAESAALDLVQLHGDEPSTLVAGFGARRIEVVRADRLAPNPSEGKEHSYDLKRFRLRDEMSDVSASSSGRAQGPLTQAAASPAESGETPDSGDRFPSWESVPMDPDSSERTSPFAFLIDAPKDARYGGTGERWSWGSARGWIARRSRPVWIAGGIGPENAVAALRASGAAGIDVASGVERAPGLKDAEKMKRMFEELDRAFA